MKKTMKLASRGRRFGAGMIDLSIPLLAYIILVAVFGFSMVTAGSGLGYGGDMGYGYGYGYGNNYSMPQATDGSLILIVIMDIILIAYIIVELVLYARGQSIGKALLGLQVVSSIDGKPFGFWKMVLRNVIVKGASAYVFLLGYIWILIDDKNRGWHDKILDSYVVDLNATANMYQRAATAAQTDANRQIHSSEYKQTEKEDDIETR